MELKDLYQFVLLIVLVGMIIGVGMITLDRFSTSTFYSRSDFNETITPSNNTHTALGHGNITAVVQVKNATDENTFPSSCYTIYQPNGTFLLNIQDNATCKYGHYQLTVVYDYNDYATATRNAVSAVSTEIANISSNWLGLIVTVAILSIILFLVVRSFGSNMRQ